MALRGRIARLLSSSSSSSSWISKNRSPCFSSSIAFSSAPTYEWDAHRLSPDQLHFRNLASDFARQELQPFAAEWDRKQYFPVQTIRKAADLGFGGIFCSPEFGGSKLSRADGAVIFESLAYGDVSTTAYLTIHNMCCSLIDRFGTDEQRSQWLPRLTSMELFSSFCLTEPGSGSDAASLQTTAQKKQGGTDYLLNGSKAFISGGGVSDVYLVMARTSDGGPKGITCFLLEKGMEGLSFGRPEHKLGWRSQPTTSVTMDDVNVPCTHIIGEENQGFKIALSGLDGGRINIGACSVGGAQFCLDAAVGYVKGRKQFGKAIAEFQNTQFKLSDMAMRVQASRLMVAHAASAFDANASGFTASAAMAKWYATQTCYNVCNDALQLYGGYGYLNDYPIERYVRDLRVHTILEGTNEIMQLIVAKEMLK